jgi:Apg6 BARA domain
MAEKPHWTAINSSLMSGIDIGWFLWDRSRGFRKLMEIVWLHMSCKFSILVAQNVSGQNIDKLLPISSSYGSGDFAINRMFLNRRFDHALVALLNCLQQLSDFAEQRDKSLRLPYR